MPKNTIIHPDELAVFLEAMKDVKPLKKHDKREPPALPMKKPPFKVPDVHKAALLFEDDSSLLPVTQEDFLSFKKHDIADNLLRKLKKGQYNVQSVLDLHGLSIRDAEIKLSHFLVDCLSHTERVVLLIHGKGKDPVAPILKNKLNQWLRHCQYVLSFCTALPKHGGTGALYVLLKNMRGFEKHFERGD